MSAEILDTTIETFKGDTCEITFTDLIEGMHIFFSVRNPKNNELVFDELDDYVNSNGEITFTITPEMSNNFVVKPADGYNIYYHGIKQVIDETGEENTILLGDNPKFSDKYILKVYLKKAEGIVENG